MTVDEPPRPSSLPTPDRQWKSTDFRAELEVWLALLEAMFEDPELAHLRASAPQHPAVLRYDRMKALATGGPLPSELESETVVDVAMMAMDRSTWTGPGDLADYWRSLIGDEVKGRMVRGMIAHGEQFTDTLLELFYWGHLRQHGVEAELVGPEGMPDIRAGAADGSPWVETKRLRLGTPPAGARRALKKANAQIKRASPDRAGVAVLQATRRHVAATFDDVPPPDVDDFRRELRVALESGRFTHTAAVVLVWDDFMVLGTPPARSLYAVRRRSLLLKHSSPITPLELTDDVVSVGQTFATWVEYAPGSIAPERGTRDVTGMATRITDQFREVSAAGPQGIRPSHARAVLEMPDGRDELDFDGLRLLLFTRQIHLGGHPYVLLVVCTERGEGPVDLVLAFRLYGEAAELQPLSVDPRAALLTLVARHGLPVNIGDSVALLHERTMLGPEESIRWPDERPCMTSFLVRRLPDGRTEVAWAFAIDTASYRAAAPGD